MRDCVANQGRTRKFIHLPAFHKIRRYGLYVGVHVKGERGGGDYVGVKSGGLGIGEEYGWEESSDAKGFEGSRARGWG